jgi:hypothetical protein
MHYEMEIAAYIGQGLEMTLVVGGWLGFFKYFLN